MCGVYCCVLQRSQSAGGQLQHGRHYEKCSRRFEVQGRASGAHSPVPNFKQLHAAWSSKLADCKAVNRSKSTKPEVALIRLVSAFCICQGQFMVESTLDSQSQNVGGIWVVKPCDCPHYCISSQGVPSMPWHAGTPPVNPQA